MKQLKFFTSQSDTMQSAKTALAALGISPNKMRVFARENAQHRFDGLVLQSSRISEDAHIDRTMAIYPFAAMVGSFLLYKDWVTFLELSTLFILIGLLVFLLRLRSGRKLLEQERSPEKQVYFFVVDVDDDQAESISNITAFCPGLIPQ